MEISELGRAECHHAVGRASFSGWCRAATLAAGLGGEVTTMTPHTAWTVTGQVDDIYRPGVVTTAADDSLQQTAARLQDKDSSAS